MNTQTGHFESTAGFTYNISTADRAPKDPTTRPGHQPEPKKKEGRRESAKG